MINFEFQPSTKVIFGKNAENCIGREIKALGGTRVLIHYGSERIEKNGFLGKICGLLGDEGLSYVKFGGVKPNPRLSMIYEGIELCRKEKVDFLLAIGGGSAIDSAKGIAVGLHHEEDVWDINEKRVKPRGSYPVASIVTIAAAGSETSKSMVLTKEDGWIKKGIHEQAIRPVLAVLNPELTFTCPPFETAGGCVDIMLHSMERYFSPEKQCDLSDRLAESVLRTIIKYAPAVLEDPCDYDARAEIMWAGSISHNDVTGGGKTADYASHQLEQELSGMFDVHHGAGLATVWCSWGRYVYKRDISRFIRYAINVWDCEYNVDCPEKTALEGINRTECFFKSLNMPTRISELDGVGLLTEQQIDELSLKCTFFETRLIGNFVKLGRDDIKAIYHMAR